MTADELKSKFTDCARQTLNESATKRVLDDLDRLETLKGIRPLSQLSWGESFAGVTESLLGLSDNRHRQKSIFTCLGSKKFADCPQWLDVITDDLENRQQRDRHQRSRHAPKPSPKDKPQEDDDGF